MAAKLSGWALSEDPDMSIWGNWNASFPIRHQAPDVKHLEMVEHHSDKIPDVGYPEKMERRKGDRPCVHGVGTHLEQLQPDSLKGYAARSPIRTPSGRSPRHLRTSHTRTIAYPIRICCPDHWLKCTSLATSFRQPATAHVPPPSDGVSGRPVRTSFVGIPKNSPQAWIALVIKKLSKHQNLTQFD